MTERVSSLDLGYMTGDLSVYPEALDSSDSLYEATNNAIIPLKQSLTFNSKRIIVDDTSAFPDKGLLRIGPAPGIVGLFELIYYGKKGPVCFEELQRGFAGSRRGPFCADGTILVSLPVSSEPHNATKDALINIETNLGLEEFPASESLNGILKAQESRFLAPKPIFRAFPLSGPPPLEVRFQNFSGGEIIRNLWDFGDGSTTLEESPIHSFLQEGLFTVKLNIISSTGAQGVATKIDYIRVNEDDAVPFFYVASTPDMWSVQTAAARTAGTDPSVAPIPTPTSPTNFTFVDQSDGNVIQRNWNFGDGSLLTEDDPNIHTATHEYDLPGVYIVTLFVVFSNNRLKRLQLPQPLIVM